MNISPEMKKLTEVRIRTENEAQNVYIGDTLMRSFCHRADDYAYTNADAYAKDLVSKKPEHRYDIRRLKQKENLIEDMKRDNLIIDLSKALSTLREFWDWPQDEFDEKYRDKHGRLNKGQIEHDLLMIVSQAGGYLQEIENLRAFIIKWSKIEIPFFNTRSLWKRAIQNGSKLLENKSIRRKKLFPEIDAFPCVEWKDDE